ncbi:Uncharacterized protein APZ42_017821 [Daphnia magna]|uniref:BED-type domain-containing protein n=1 Tax=Daphnia magna TaxID=35525 RepID=A0A164ZJR2_9CRUS|nr:Uncharacterized protein APZ42_017821 [Daphnia magna]
MPKRKTSAVWDYFENIQVDDRRVLRSALCKETCDFKGNTSNLWSHLENSKDEQHIEAHHSIKDKCHPPRNITKKTDNRPARLLDIDTDVENENSEIAEDGAMLPAFASTSAASMSCTSTSSSTVGAYAIFYFKFEVERIFFALCLYISRAMQPLSLVEEKNFREFVLHIDPRLTIPCRNTMTHTILPNLYREAKAKLIKELEGIKQVALITDCWTSINNEGYMTVTVYYLSDKLKMVSRVLNTIMIEESHTAMNSAKELRKIMTEWNLMNKISGIVTDNAANIVKAVSDINNWRYVPCFAHTLSLAVKDAVLKNKDFKTILTNCRDIVTYFHQSNLANIKLITLII